MDDEGFTPDGFTLPYDSVVNEIRTRQDVEDFFDVEDGVIASPGKFEREAVYVPYFWEKGLDGWADDEPDDSTYVFYIVPEDKAEFPELGNRTMIAIRTREDGYVYEVPVPRL